MQPIKIRVFLSQKRKAFIKNPNKGKIQKLSKLPKPNWDVTQRPRAAPFVKNRKIVTNAKPSPNNITSEAVHSVTHETNKFCKKQKKS